MATDAGKMVVFGTGVFLRAFVCDFAERGGYSVAMVSSTTDGDGRVEALNKGGGAFTRAIRGVETDGSVTDTHRSVRCITSAYTARAGWEEFVASAGDLETRIVVSNVTESAFKLNGDDEATTIGDAAHGSFPAKLTAWLHARFVATSGNPDAGVVVLPCELVEQNGSKLRGMVGEMAARWQLADAFGDWLDECCVFADTLVDRIVAGVPSESEKPMWKERVGFDDPLLTIGEPYALWAIRGDDKLRARIAPLVDASGGHVVVADDISPFALKKVRILNGTHTCMGLLTTEFPELETVLQVTQHETVAPYLRALMEEEILPTLSPQIPASEIEAYAKQTWARYSNPFLAHKLTAIRSGQAAKWQNRLVPTIALFAERFAREPERIARCRAILESLEPTAK